VARSALPAAALAPGGDAYRVRVALDAGAQPAWRDALRPGMRVQASLVAEHRTLLQWALEPLAALRVAAK
jgi:membrane fusion protein